MKVSALLFAAAGFATSANALELTPDVSIPLYLDVFVCSGIR